jgi:hypothetical protein
MENRIIAHPMSEEKSNKINKDLPEDIKCKWIHINIADRIMKKEKEEIIPN